MRTSVALSLAWICLHGITARSAPENQLTGVEGEAPASESEGNEPGQRLPTQSADTGLPASITKQPVTFKSHDLTLVGFVFKPQGTGTVSRDRLLSDIDAVL
jgi:hypothetical protein